MLFGSVHTSVVSLLSISCHKTVMQHHEHAKQKLRDELHAQFSADLDQQVAAHAQETQQARLVNELHGLIFVIGTQSQLLSHIHKH